MKKFSLIIMLSSTFIFSKDISTVIYIRYDQIYSYMLNKQFELLELKVHNFDYNEKTSLTECLDLKFVLKNLNYHQVKI